MIWLGKDGQIYRYFEDNGGGVYYSGTYQSYQ